ncbi:hypothetical protein ACPTFX_30040, partial [Pseudomonas aeruginosa]
DKANNLIDRIHHPPSTSPQDTLKRMEPPAEADVIRYEHPQIQAIVVAYLQPDHAPHEHSQNHHTPPPQNPPPHPPPPP